MKTTNKKLGLSKTTLSNLSLGQVSGGSALCTVGCASLADQCPSMDIPCDPIQSRTPCYTVGCAGGSSRPPLPRKL